MTNQTESQHGAGPVQLVEPQPGVQYTLEAVAHLTGVSRRSILVYCKSGLIRTVEDPDSSGFTFNDEAIYAIRRIEQLRTGHGVNLAGIRIIFDLLRQLRQLEEEMRFMRL